VNGLSYVDIPGATDTHVNGINNLNQFVGSYTDTHGLVHSYICDSNSCRLPLDYPGAASTVFNAINDNGQIVGSYTDTSGALHGLRYSLTGSL